MITAQMEFSGLEQAYDMIAAAIDNAGEERSTLFLAKLSLALSAQLRSPDQLATIIDASLRDLD